MLISVACAKSDQSHVACAKSDQRPKFQSEPQKMARNLKFEILNEAGLYSKQNENKGTDQLKRLHCR